MYKIRIEGISGEIYPNNFPRSLYPDLVNNAYSDSIFSEYFSESFKIGNKLFINEQPLIDKGVSGGNMWFEIKNDKIWTITEYESKEKLNEEELEMIKKYTKGQWSDGIGEGFEQFPIMQWNGQDVYLSPWFFGQKLEISQIEKN